jgi:hypothetical protein
MSKLDELINQAKANQLTEEQLRIAKNKRIYRELFNSIFGGELFEALIEAGFKYIEDKHCLTSLNYYKCTVTISLQSTLLKDTNNISTKATLFVKPNDHAILARSKVISVGENSRLNTDTLLLALSTMISSFKP